MSDVYMSLKLKRNSKKEYVAELVTPLVLGSGHAAKVSLCDVQYLNDNDQFNNAKVAIFDFAWPRYCTETDANGNQEVKFTRCQIEKTEYTPATLCNAINQEILSKMHSSFNLRMCEHLYNPQCNRVEVRIDGRDYPNVKTDPLDLCTLILYWPLTLYLGFTNDPSNRGETVVLVSKFWFNFMYMKEMSKQILCKPVNKYTL